MGDLPAGPTGREYWTAQLEEDDDAKWLLTHSAWTNPDFTLLEDRQGRGFLFVTPFRDEEPDVMYVYYAYTLPVHRNEGVMSTLIAEAARRWRSMVLEIDRAWELVWFWEARGFRFSSAFWETYRKKLWAYQGILPKIEHYSLHRPFYYIVEGSKAYPVNRYHDRLGCHVWSYCHPLNSDRLTWGRCYETTFQQELQRAVTKHPELASIYPSFDELEQKQAASNHRSFWRPYPDSYYPVGDKVYLYRGSSWENTSEDNQPWTGETEARLYEERCVELASKYVVTKW